MIIEEAIRYIRELFEGEASGHDVWHTMRVYNTAVRLAEEEGADIEVTALGALLHDADDRKIFPETAAEHLHARTFLNEHGFEDPERIIHIIEQVSFQGTDSVVPDTIEGKCVQDADRLDAIGAIGIARTFAFGGAHGRPMYDPAVKPRTALSGEEYRNSGYSPTLNHFDEKLFLLKNMMNTESAKKLAEERDAFMHAFKERFLAEWDGQK